MNPFADGWDEAKVEAALARAVPEELLHVPIVVSLNPCDCAWSFNICRTLATHTDPRVRGNAILGFGHLARTCGALSREIGPLIASDQTVLSVAAAIPTAGTSSPPRSSARRPTR